MTSIDYESYYNANLSLVSHNNTSYQDIITKSYGPVNAQDFVMFAGISNQAQGGGLSGDIETQFKYDAAVIGQSIRSISAAYQPGPFWHAHVIDETINTHTIELEHKNATAGSGSGSWGNHLLAIGGLNIVAYSSFTSAVTIGTSEVDLQSISYTPSEGGKNYILFGSCDSVGGTGSQEVQVKIYIDGQEKQLGRSESGSADRHNVCNIVKKFTLTASAHTVKFAGAASSGNAQIENQYLTLVQVDA